MDSCGKKLLLWYKLGLKALRIMDNDGLKSFWEQYQKRNEKLRRFEGVQSVKVPLSSDLVKANALSTFDIIVFSIIDWDYRFQRPQQIAVRFAKNNRHVFYTCTSFSDNYKPLLRRIQDNVFEVWLPGDTSLNIYKDALNESTIEAIVKTFSLLRSEFDIVEAIIFVDLPFWSKAAMRLREIFGWMVIYDCMDFYKGFSNTSEKMLKGEDDLSENSDLILATSRPLFKERALHNSNCLLIPNGTEFDHFNVRPPDVPRELKDLNGPIIGYYGAISDWFDGHLIESLAKARPNWNFILIGNKSEADLSALSHLRNIQLLGEKHYSILPSYLHAFDICIIPFKKSKLSEATNPVKLFEYLSAGKPVVATDLTELQYYRDYITLASGTEEWLNAIENSLNQRSPEEIVRRENFAKLNSWEERCLQIQQEIISIYKKISVIVIATKRENYTIDCLDSIYRKSGYPNFEVIVLYNALSDETQSHLEKIKFKFPNLKSVQYFGSEELYTAIDHAFDLADGRYITLLGGNTILTRGWMGRLLRHLIKDPSVGIIAPTYNDMIVEGSRDNIPFPDMSQIDSFARKIAKNYDGERCNTDMSEAPCIFMSKEISNLSKERFQVEEPDDNPIFKAKKSSCRFICAKDVFIYRLHS